jgi:KaiC/GvpD/RAD55 family RecA-like ATPase
LPRIPLIEDLLEEPLPRGVNLLVEFDSKSQWYALSLVITAGWLRTGGDIVYNNAEQSPDVVRLQLRRFGLDVDALEKSDRLRIYDLYTQTLGQKSRERYVAPLKVIDASLTFSQQLFHGRSNENLIRIWDNASTMARFNEEKAWVEFELSRRFPLASINKSMLILGIIKGVHSDWAYRQLEAAADGTIEVKFDETGEEARNLMRISSLRTVAFDSKWHEVKVTKDSATLADL